MQNDAGHDALILSINLKDIEDLNVGIVHKIFVCKETQGETIIISYLWY